MINNNDKYNVICLSNQLWDFHSWTNKKHVMYRLSKQGHNVLFVDPPINAGFVLLRQILRGNWSVLRLLTQTKRDKDSNAKVFTPVNLLTNSQITSNVHISRINSIANANFDPSLKTVLWVYHVQIKELKNYLNKLNYDILVYDCVDNYFGFPEEHSFYKTTISKKQLKTQEEDLTKRADVVFASAPGLVDRLKKINPNTHFTPNVGDYEKFKDTNKVKDLPTDIKDLSHPIIGFTGALDEYKFDLPLFKKLLDTYPGYSFVLIGQLGLKDKKADLAKFGLDSYENVHYLGPKDYSVIHKYFAAFDAFIIPYVLNDYTVGGCFPVKFHDALSAGLPVVVTNMPAYMPFGDVCYISETHNEFVQNLKAALSENSDDKILKRKSVAKQNNWDNKVKTMLGFISDLT